MSGLHLTPTNAVTDLVRPAAGKSRFVLGDGTNGTTANVLYRQDSAGTMTPLIPAAYTDEQAQDAAGALFTDSNQVDFTYDDAGNMETARILSPVQPATTGASRTYVVADSGRYYRRSNGGAAMTDTLPTLTAADNGWRVIVGNVGTAVAETLTLTGAGGQTFGETGLTTYVLKYSTRQNFVWDGNTLSWRFESGNANLLKTYAGAVNGDLLTMLDSTALTTAKATAAQVAAASALATSALQGAMSALDKVTVTNLHFDVTNYGVSPGNAAAANVTALNLLLQTTAPAGSVIYFPQGTYQFNAGLTALTKDFVFRGVRGQSVLALTANLAGNFITLSNTGYYTSFYDLYFSNFTSQTAGYVIEAQNNVNVLIQDCFFVGSSSATLAGGINFTGSSSGNGAVLRNTYIAGFTGVGINVASALDSVYYSDLEIVNNQGGANSIGLQFTNGGAAVIVDSQIISCGICLNMAPTTGVVVASVYASNTFFDQGRTAALQITGAGTALRSHFDACWFTLATFAPAGSAAVLINTTGSAVHGGLIFSGCHVVNTPTVTAGGCYGFLMSAIQDVLIDASDIAGWATALQVTPSASGLTALSITNNIVGASGNVVTNTTGIVLNGGTNYTSILVQGNNLTGCTTPLTDASVASASNKSIAGNVGLASPPMPNPAAQVLPLATTYVTPAFLVPANALRVGTRVRFTIDVTNAATLNNTTILAKAGTAGTTADATVVTTAATTGTATVGAAEIVVELVVRSVGAAGVLVGKARFVSIGGFGGTATSQVAVLATTTVNTTVANFLGVAITTSAASVVTVQEASVEVVNQ